MSARTALDRADLTSGFAVGTLGVKGWRAWSRGLKEHVLVQRRLQDCGGEGPNIGLGRSGFLLLGHGCDHATKLIGDLSGKDLKDRAFFTG